MVDGNRRHHAEQRLPCSYLFFALYVRKRLNSGD